MTIDNFDWTLFWRSACSMSWFEIAMLVCFGASWSFSIHKMLKTGKSEGKSLLFLLLVMIGYVFGVIHKLFFHLDVVILLYAALFFVVLIDCVVMLRLRKRGGETTGGERSLPKNGQHG